MSKQVKPTREGRRIASKAPAKSATIGAKKSGAGRRAAEAAPAQPESKLAHLVALLRRPGGATLEAMIDMTGWQAHSVRGAISGTIKKKLALAVESARVDGVRVYRIVGR